jgi:nucleoside-diphosphate-sugar epimerase
MPRMPVSAEPTSAPPPRDEADLEERLSRPTPALAQLLATVPGDLVVLGAGGKMGPSLARMARRADPRRRVIAVSRWSDRAAAAALESEGVETIGADLLDPRALATLPDAPNVVFMAGQKFGTTGAPAMTWAMNTIVPANCAERYKSARITAFSTGNVYALTPTSSSGSRETDALGPVGEYAASCVGRERIFEAYAERNGTRVSIIRLNYAIDLRYGVLVDIALKVKRREPVPVDMGYVNIIWQGDANRIALESLPHASSPPFVLNVAGADRLSVRDMAEWFGARFSVPIEISGTERADALLSDTTRMRSIFAAPEVGTTQLFEMVADWVEHDGPLLGKPTKFEARDGKF